MVCVRNIGKGMMHFVGLAKMGKTKYTVSGRKKNAAENLLPPMNVNEERTAVSTNVNIFSSTAT